MGGMYVVFVIFIWLKVGGAVDLSWWLLLPVVFLLVDAMLAEWLKQWRVNRLYREVMRRR